MTAAAAAVEAQMYPNLAATDEWFAEVGSALRGRRLAPYMGSGLAALSPGITIPTSYENLAAFFAANVALPRRARGNAWAAAQYVESRHHRSTVTKLMRAAFAPEVLPLAFHAHLAKLDLPLIVDTWYDGALRLAFRGRTGWIEVQGINRAQIGETGWFRAYDPGGNCVPLGSEQTAATLIYKPHGCATPAGNFLIADSDYVEVLTEIDIQTPIPQSVRTRRTDLGFLFLGCRFHDQLLRTFARQIVKRSRGPHYAVFDHGPLTRMEQRFVRELDLRAIDHPLSSALDLLVAASA